MQSIKSLKDIKNKKILVRVDFNVPIKNGKVVDDFRIRMALPTVNFLRKKGAQITLITHLGKDGSDSLKPVINRFFEISKISSSEINFFENIRKFKGEEKNDSIFAQKIASEFDLYVNEAFSVSHREHASVVGIPKYLPSYAGFQLEKEIKNLTKVTQNTKHPFLFILGGAKFSTKMPLVQRYLKLADNIFMGGALLNDLLKAQGYEIGKSLVDDSKIPKEILTNQKLFLPMDVRVLSAGKLINKKIEEIKKDEFILDIGKESIKYLEIYIKKARLILWNGPLGKYEDGGGEATKKILQLILKSKAQVVIGGGDLVSCIPNKYLGSNSSASNLFVSTGGGATLEFLAQGTLPGIKVLG